jgi:hypothetical protein
MRFHTEAESKEIHGVSYVGVDLTLCPLPSRLQHIYHDGLPYARVELKGIDRSFELRGDIRLI